MITDPRFSSLHSDPRFQNVPMHKSKVAIDSRFNRMFSDKRFASSSAHLDKRGRPKKSSSENPLLHYYKQEQPLEEEEEEEAVGGVEEEEAKKEESSSDEDVEGEESVAKPLQNLSRLSSEEETGSDVDTDAYADEEYEVHVEGEPLLQVNSRS